jgi:hypothetical protein
VLERVREEEDLSDEVLTALRASISLRVAHRS